MNIGIVIQARLSSTRLPGKILLDFYDGKNILEILYQRLISNINCQVIIATTNNENDAKLVDFCNEKKINYFRGSEQDVLSRFINTAEHFNLTHIIRICSDNPFLYADYLKKLSETLIQYPCMDYISYKIAGRPSILTHYGFFAELVSLGALYIANESEEKNHHEHVTSYIYTHEDRFNIKWLGVSKTIENNDIRLTVDDSIDFMLAKNIYKRTGEVFDPETIIKIVNTDPEIKKLMMQQITKNAK
jgi:spore coat polysaccharide biosynthesis protein SpsF